MKTAGGFMNTTSGHLDRRLRKGVSAQGVLTLADNRLWMPGGNVISPACYSLQDGRCLSRSVEDGSPRANRGEEIGVLLGEYLVFGGRLRYSGIRNYVNPGAFTIAKINSAGVGRGIRIGAGKIPPAWSPNTFVMASGPQTLPVCVDNATLVEYRGDTAWSDQSRQARHADPLKTKWTAQELRNSDPAAFVIAGNTIITALETPRPRSLAPNWELAGLDPDTGKVVWTKRLPSAVVPGGVLVDRHGLLPEFLGQSGPFGLSATPAIKLATRCGHGHGKVCWLASAHRSLSCNSVSPVEPADPFHEPPIKRNLPAAAEDTEQRGSFHAVLPKAHDHPYTIPPRSPYGMQRCG